VAAGRRFQARWLVVNSRLRWRQPGRRGGRAGKHSSSSGGSTVSGLSSSRQLGLLSKLRSLSCRAGTTVNANQFTSEIHRLRNREETGRKQGGNRE